MCVLSIYLYFCDILFSSSNIVIYCITKHPQKFYPQKLANYISSYVQMKFIHKILIQNYFFGNLANHEIFVIKSFRLYGTYLNSSCAKLCVEHCIFIFIVIKTFNYYNTQSVLVQNFLVKWLQGLV